MGAKIDFTSHIDITEHTPNNPWPLTIIGYRDLTDELISKIADDTNFFVRFKGL